MVLLCGLNEVTHIKHWACYLWGTNTGGWEAGRWLVFFVISFVELRALIILTMKIKFKKPPVQCLAHSVQSTVVSQLWLSYFQWPLGVACFATCPLSEEDTSWIKYQVKQLSFQLLLQPSLNLSWKGSVSENRLIHGSEKLVTLPSIASHKH